MPRKIRELDAELRRAGFIVRTKRGKGSHRMYFHPDNPEAVANLAGKDGADAKPYQEQEVRDAIDKVRPRT